MSNLSHDTLHDSAYKSIALSFPFISSAESEAPSTGMHAELQPAQVSDGELNECHEFLCMRGEDTTSTLCEAFPLFLLHCFILSAGHSDAKCNERQLLHASKHRRDADKEIISVCQLYILLCFLLQEILYSSKLHTTDSSGKHSVDGCLQVWIMQ